jgi:hypothetical protein
MKKKFTLLIAALVLCLPPNASASLLTFDFAVQFSNNVQPGGPSPWLTATFDDTAASAGNDVRLTLTANGLTGAEFISDVYFNIDPLINPLQVQSTLIAQPVNTVEGISFLANAFQAGSDGRYDVRLALNNAACCRLNDNETVVLDFNWTAGMLLAQHFNVLAAPGGGNGPFYAAAHLQGIGANANDSTWIADDNGGQGDCPGCTPTVVATPVPDTAPTMLLLATSLLTAARYRKMARS